tara:strand:+ start:580 stop:750 length:171 start_codon:yes stop_codon:yes gene_type:complete
MPGMTERKRYMRGETKTARGDYGKKVRKKRGGEIKKAKHKGCGAVMSGRRKTTKYS